MLKIGVLALQGNVVEHSNALAKASRETGINIEIRQVRKKEELEGLDGIILPGGESTTLSLLLEKGGMIEKLKEVRAVFGTCAGLILMAKNANGKVEGQKGINVMDIEVERNAYGSQLDSFESELNCELLNDEKIMFIRAPKIKKIGKNVKIIAKLAKSGGAVIVEERNGGKFYLGAACHPELSTSRVHEYFLKKIMTGI
ncbi:MAG: pyridoxal 5'-phosphate synthase glutaminase subunit PdxT [Candidatus Micrarchaeota archaeon]